MDRPVQVMTMSTCLMTSFSFTSLKPSMLDRTERRECERTSNTRGHQNATRAVVLPGLQGTNGVNLCDIDNGAHRFEGGAAAFSHLGVIDKRHYKNIIYFICINRSKVYSLRLQMSCINLKYIHSTSP